MRKQHNGYTKIKSTIIRSIDSFNGKLVNETIGERVVEIELDVEGTSCFIAGKYFGYPEDCYPDDEDSEITDWSITKNDPYYGRDDEIQLTLIEYDELTNKIREAIEKESFYE